MINTLIGIKKNMTSTYDARGRRVGATVVQIDPNFITQIKSEKEKDGYNAIQLGMGTKKSVKKPQIGHAAKAGLDKKIRYFREVRISGNPSTSLGTIQPGQEIKVDQVFSAGDSVKVTGISKGKGFQGGVKRYNFAGGPKTHGQSDRHRAPGSIGSGTTPGRVYKGKKMAGHMGMDQVSLRGLEVISIDKQNNLMTIKGGIPGAVGGLLTITKLGRIKGYIAPPEEKEEEVEEEPQPKAGQPVVEKESNEPKETEVKEEVKEGEQDAKE
ncbi:MAG: 50S ribosomal protein L3 [Candidatus Daviesbacteria bacterium]|nr:50S ribosomal protein L3 [Candidatus Daviesbacteria bacterium]